jgi:hypothetical protein
MPGRAVVHFRAIDNNHATALGIEHSSDVPGSEPGEPVPVLDDDRGHLWVPEKGKKLTSLALRADPSSVTTEPTEYPFDVAQTVTFASCLSRSGFLSADETRA